MHSRVSQTRVGTMPQQLEQVHAAVCAGLSAVPSASSPMTSSAARSRHQSHSLAAQRLQGLALLSVGLVGILRR
jgi:hypothetical protein